MYHQQHCGKTGSGAATNLYHDRCQLAQRCTLPAPRLRGRVNDARTMFAQRDGSALCAVDTSKTSRASTNPEALVLAIAYDATAGTLPAHLLPELKRDPRLRLTRGPADLSRANRALLVLAPGVVRDEQLLSLVTEAARIDSTHHQDRTVAVYGEPAGWIFGGTEHRAQTGAG